MTTLFTNGVVILPDRLAFRTTVVVDGERIVSLLGPNQTLPDGEFVDLGGAYLTPGFVDIHIHGGGGHDFMDGTEDAFRAVCQTHARHGTTSLLPTTTVASHEQHLAVLELCRRFSTEDTGGARSLGAHFYGPYFAPAARGCHPAAALRPPLPAEYEQYLKYASVIRRATIAPELPGAEAFARACKSHGIGVNLGHSHCTFEQADAARDWGADHVDHLFCAMSDRAKLRLSQTFPMRGGLMEATLYFDEFTTEVIADGQHLDASLLKLAYKVKGAGRLALVTDASRAVDCPDGPYIFGPKDCGEPFQKRNGVGLLPDGVSLASSVVGMDDCVRTFHRLTGVPIVEVIHMATLTPARIAGVDDRIGSIAPGKLADLVVLDAKWNVKAVYIAGRKCHDFVPGRNA